MSLPRQERGGERDGKTALEHTPKEIPTRGVLHAPPSARTSSSRETDLASCAAAERSARSGWGGPGTNHCPAASPGHPPNGLPAAARPALSPRGKRQSRRLFGSCHASFQARRSLGMCGLKGCRSRGPVSRWRPPHSNLFSLRFGSETGGDSKGAAGTQPMNELDFGPSCAAHHSVPLNGPFHLRETLFPFLRRGMPSSSHTPLGEQVSTTLRIWGPSLPRQEPEAHTSLR